MVSIWLLSPLTASIKSTNRTRAGHAKCSTRSMLAPQQQQQQQHRQEIEKKRVKVHYMFYGRARVIKMPHSDICGRSKTLDNFEQTFGQQKHLALVPLFSLLCMSNCLHDFIFVCVCLLHMLKVACHQFATPTSVASCLFIVLQDTHNKRIDWLLHTLY